MRLDIRQMIDTQIVKFISFTDRARIQVFETTEHIEAYSRLAVV